MVAAIYPVGGPDEDNRSDLRFSLRSITANAPTITETWVIGDIPDWFTGTRMPLEPLGEKYANIRQSITRFVNYPGAPNKFYLFMDDVFVTEPVVGALPICHLGPADKFSPYRTGDGTYARAGRDTTQWLHNNGHPNPLAYVAHTPLLLNTHRTRAFLDTYPAGQLLEPCMLYIPAGAGGLGTRTGNAKCKQDDNLEHKLGLPMPYLSGNPDSWAGGLGTWVRARFDTPSRWETYPSY